MVFGYSFREVIFVMDIEKADVVARSVDRLKGLYWLIDALLVAGCGDGDKPISGLNNDELCFVGQCLEMIVSGIADDLASLEG